MSTVRTKQINDLPVEYLRECFDLDATVGTLTWRQRPRHHFACSRGHAVFNSKYAGVVAGSPNEFGYLIVRIGARLYRAHRIVYALAFGHHSKGVIDHRDGNPTNNAPLNLREATYTQNQLNKRVSHSSATGVKGVYKSVGGFYSKLRLPGGKSVYLGYFRTIEAAAEAHRAAVAEHHGEFGRAA